MTQAGGTVHHLLPSRGKSVSRTHFPSRWSLCTRTWASCFSDCVRFGFSSCGSCLCFFLYFGLDGDKGRASFTPRGQEPECQEGKKPGDSNPDQATRQKQVTLAPGKGHPFPRVDTARGRGCRSKHELTGKARTEERWEEGLRVRVWVQLLFSNHNALQLRRSVRPKEVPTVTGSLY